MAGVGIGPRLTGPASYNRFGGRQATSSPTPAPAAPTAAPRSAPRVTVAGGGSGGGGGGGMLPSFSGGPAPMLPTTAMPMPGPSGVAAPQPAAAPAPMMAGLQQAIEDPGAGWGQGAATALNPHLGRRTPPAAMRVLSQLTQVY